jgi:TolA-binding protein
MKFYGNILLLAVLLVLNLSACYIVRESERPRDDYFQPVPLLPQRVNPTNSTVEVDRLKNQLESATAAAIMLRDSLTALQNYAGTLLVSTRSLIDKVSELEAKEFLSNTKQNNIERDVAILQSENKKLTQQVEELHAQFVSNRVEIEPSNQKPVYIVQSSPGMYGEGLLLFYQKHYKESIVTFKGLLEKGIQEGLSDNCEYWVGECHFAVREYRAAVVQFQKVLTIESSNKKIDAYFMLGRSCEHLRDLAKARWAYEELNAHYPQNEHANAAKSRLAILKKKSPAPQPQTHKKGNSRV